MFLRLFIVAFCLTIVCNCYAQEKRFVFAEPKMGSPFQIIFYDTDSFNANKLAKQSFALVDSLVYIFSDYNDSSELNRLCATAGKTIEPVSVSPALYDILQLSKIAHEKSDGTFDITLGPLTKLWRKARKEKQFPSDSLVKEKLRLTGFSKIKIDTVTKKVMLLQMGMQLDLGGIAQGYIAQKVIDFLRSKNINTALVDVSGDIVACGTPPATNGWSIGINIPEHENEMLHRHLSICNKAVTTSGDVYQFMEHDGKHYSHLIDPQTGYGITTQKNVTVIASDGTTADWLTKACSILSIRKAKKLAHSCKAELLIGTLKKGEPVFLSTKGFKKYWNRDKANRNAFP
ncbi:FAD:protein FMN transferase [soil metagenome]